MPALTDSHCHFNHGKFAQDLPDCLARARVADVRQMVVVGFDLASSEQAVALAEQYSPELFAAVAVHPHDSRHWDIATAQRLRELASHPRVVAWGEIGLDFHYDFSPRVAQYAAFREQMALARETELPVIIHCREAYPETLAVLEAEGITQIGGVMHCWAGSPAEAEQALALGLSLGFGGTLTFKSAESVRQAAQQAPADRLLVETDAPYLAPVPHRGERNEPAYTRLVAERLAELRGLDYPALADLTTANTLRLFPRMNDTAL